MSPILRVCLRHGPYEGTCQPCKRETAKRRNAAPTRKMHHTKTHATVKRIVYATHPHICVDCHTTQDLTIDYVVPLIAGGKMHSTNAVIRCRSCNSRRGGSLSQGGTGHA